MPYVHGHSGKVEAINVPPKDFAFEADVESWSINQSHDNLKVFAKGGAWKTLLTSAREYTATLVVLLDDSLVDADSLVGITIAATDLIYKQESGTGFKHGMYSLVGVVTSIDTDDPIDGPVKFTMAIEGSGALTHQLAVPGT